MVTLPSDATLANLNDFRGVLIRKSEGKAAQ